MIRFYLGETYLFTRDYQKNGIDLVIPTFIKLPVARSQWTTTNIVIDTIDLIKIDYDNFKRGIITYKTTTSLSPASTFAAIQNKTVDGNVTWYRLRSILSNYDFLEYGLYLYKITMTNTDVYYSDIFNICEDIDNRAFSKEFSIAFDS